MDPTPAPWPQGRVCVCVCVYVCVSVWFHSVSGMFRVERLFISDVEKKESRSVISDSL